MTKLAEPIRKNFIIHDMETEQALSNIREYIQANRPGSVITDSEVIRYALVMQAGAIINEQRAELPHPAELPRTADTSTYGKYAIGDISLTKALLEERKKGE